MRNKKSKARIIFSALLSVISAFIVFLRIYHPPLNLHPDNQTFFEFEIVSNVENDRGFSEMKFDTSSGHLHFRYNFEKDNDDPFAILIFHAHELARHLRLRKYKYIDLDIDPKLTQDFTISMYFYIPGFSDMAFAETHRPYSMKVRVKENQSHYHYKISDFATPVWWFSHYRVDHYSLPKTNWNDFTHLTISNYEFSESEAAMQIVIKRLRFTDSVKDKTAHSAIFGVFIFVISYLFYPKIRKKEPTVTTTTLVNKSSKYGEEDVEKLLEYIDENLSNPLLSLDLIEKETGISHFAVNEILKDKKDMQYKNYLDGLRISEAKRMLVETEHQISVIAEQVGYCYSNSFSRIFGKYCGMAPNEYRKKYKRKSKSS
jgi:AraC-like DNA-binding protein